MLIIVRLLERNSRSILSRTPSSTLSFSSEPASPQPLDPDEFRVLDLKSKKTERVRRQTFKMDVPPPRTNQMATDQDWSSVWPGPRTFHPASVPLPIHQGWTKKNQPPPDKFANAELMKIPNFLHLTPPAVAKHCQALKQFCTTWPKELESDKQCEKHFPLEVITTDYCYSSPTIREPLARIATLRVKLFSLNLDTHAKDKLLRLVGEKYNHETDLLTITADRCPLRKQNLDYAEYLLTAVYHESWRVEAWEAEKSPADMEYYDWDKSESRNTLVTLHAWPNPPTDEDYETIPNAIEYKIAVSDLINNGEDHHSVNKYREVVRNMLALKQ